ncbi:MAG TPA: hypothetical protein VHC69_06220 [Polyangiaceae bacterium]|nr:hypothetical protein [Polyangiaceae bacterium]
MRALVLGSLFWLEGCGAGQYQIPDVAPVVKQKPQDDLLENIEGNTDNSSSSSSSTSAGGSSDTSSSSGGSDDSSKK